MPVTCVSVVVMPRVAKGARRQAWKASVSMRPSGMRCLSGEGADLRHQVGGKLEAVARGALAIVAAALARKAHARVLRHRGDERFDALEENILARERRRIDRDDRLPDARGLALLAEEAV